MKIVVRHEGASEQEVEQTCVWIVGDDGETVGTEYLKPGEQVDVDVSGGASIEASFCEVGPINAPTDAERPQDDEPTPEDPPAPSSGEQAASTSDAGASSEGGGDTPGAPGVASGGGAGGEVAQ